MPPRPPTALFNPGCFPTGPHISMGPQTSSSSWPSSVGSHASIPPTNPQFAPGCLPYYPIYPPQMPHMPQMPTSQVIPSMLPPVMALILPNYMYPQLGGLPQLNLAGAAPLNTPIPNLNTATAPQPMPQLNPFTPQFNPAMPQMNPVLNPAAVGHPGLMPSLMPFNPTMPAVPQPFYNPNIMYPPFPNTVPMTPASGNLFTHGPSRSCTPQSGGGLANEERDDADSPLFHSRCSSPLNLVQLEELAGTKAEGSAMGLQQTPPPVGAASQGMSGSNSNGDTNGDDDNVSHQILNTHSSDCTYINGYKHILIFLLCRNGALKRNQTIF